MLSYDQIKLYLPKYLTPESSRELFEELSGFPNNIDRIYQPINCREKILQGDGLDSLPIINLPENKIINSKPVMVISNSCDNDIDNKRLFSTNICYCPLFKLRKYRQHLEKYWENASEETIRNHIESIKQQKHTHIFFLPQGKGMEEDYLIFFCNIISCNIEHVYDNLKNINFLFRLSDYGLYIFVVKLSIFITRLNEGKERNSI